MKNTELKDKEHGGADDVRQNMVEITIKNEPYPIHRGNTKVTEIKELGGINPNHILVQIIEGQLIGLANDASVTIKGGEVFQSKPPVGDNS